MSAGQAGFLCFGGDYIWIYLGLLWLLRGQRQSGIFSFFNNSVKTEIIDVIKHIDYIRGLIGINHIVFGTNYDGINSVPSVLENIAKIDKLKETLYKNSGEVLIRYSGRTGSAL